ncbi:MAG: DUF4465 domain-containing protein [Bacteroidales bacterium]|nr:DUF4465 domain-containing protein [Bacteroidales bacterium]
MKKIFTLFAAATALSLSAAESLTLTLDWDNDDNRSIPVVEAGTTITIESNVEGGEAPYTYRWVSGRGEEVGTAATLSVVATVPESYRLFVTSADGQTATEKANVFVNAAKLVVATFDDLPLEPESSYPGDMLVEEPDAFDAIFSGSMQFTNSYMPEWNYWCGYSYANETKTSFSGLSDQFRNAVGGGAANSANYGVSFMDYADTRIYVTHAAEGMVVPGMYVTNEAYFLNSALNGDGFCPAFTHEDKDYYKLVVEGLNEENEVVGTVEVMLFDYSNETPEIVTDWKYVDLTPLGAVHRLRLGRESSKFDFAPAYVCIDQIGAENPGASVTSAAVSSLRLTSAASGILSVVGTDGKWTLTVYSADGIERASYSGIGASTVSTAFLPTGVYVARVVAGNAVATLRFAK